MYLNLHTHTSSSVANVLEIVNKFPNQLQEESPFFSVGIHPWYSNVAILEEELALIESVLLRENCLAIGECGLDKRIDTPLETQILVLEKQLLLAKKYKKPVILHCVSAFQELIAIKKRLNIEVPMIIHGFSKNSAVAESLIKNGFYLSFGKYLLRNPELIQVLHTVPLEYVFLETDTIEESIVAVYQKAMEVSKTIEKQIEINFEKVFQKNIII